MMINREGIGDLLADGVKVAAEKIGKGSEGLRFMWAARSPACTTRSSIPC